MQEKTDQWMELAAQAVSETDPKKLLKLVEEINRVLEEKGDRLNFPRDSSENE